MKIKNEKTKEKVRKEKARFKKNNLRFERIRSKLFKKAKNAKQKTLQSS